MELRQCKPIKHTLVFCEFPDDGPSQGDVSRWIEDNGGKMSLYDGAVEEGVETSTGANWRWRYGVITPSTTKHVYVGDYIVKLPTGLFEAYKPDVFKALFEITPQQSTSPDGSAE